MAVDEEEVVEGSEDGDINYFKITRYYNVSRKQTYKRGWSFKLCLYRFV